jgi:hypothetical protein
MADITYTVTDSLPEDITGFEQFSQSDNNLIGSFQINNLFNPQKFVSTIEDIFLELDYFFGKYSWIYCDSLKRLMSLAAFEFGELVSDNCGDWVVIDDKTSDIEPYVDNVVKCRSWLGLTEDEYKEIKDILK